MNDSFIPHADASLAQWLDYVANLHFKDIDLGLERVKKVAEKLDVLSPAKWVITVGGTNGKGTTCRVLERILIEDGYKVGVYSSPHLICYRERVRIQEKMLPEKCFTDAFDQVEKARGQISLTYFEFGTLVALLLFKSHQLGVVVLEVGLGGRLDATNIVDSDVAAITNIDFDHIKFLGKDRHSIGREKAGIFRTNKPAVVADPDIPDSVIRVAKEKAAHLRPIDQSWTFRPQGNQWIWESKERMLIDLPLPNVPLINAACALAVLHYFPKIISKEAIKRGLKGASLAGRFQMIDQKPLVILDVAHNPHAARYLLNHLTQFLKNAVKPGAKLHAVVGMLKDKDIKGTLDILSERVDHWYCATLSEPRGAPAQILASFLQKSAFLSPDVKSAWNQAMQAANPEDILLVFGSFHTIAPVMSALNLRSTGDQ
ncbi:MULTISPECIES: bifunctional tetrahydrofolate synthase/dihydrofolate synthase [Candidatus Williamhamiltonella]|uniref:Dihydrofolate synthase/folylpolyglutamate synthase n=1 Tax=Candidatus Williamhamiltonella defendens TaxID=138072 RepID=A0A2D3TE82_9ENTR|nr:bifunctional tetrahydrofolate synthase/dihydrofolate synthase [Candidatus Hamiltonella defensa]ATW33994.1 bifunctional tetrahydrofolate synthase/dihydrofolate synthase [Candidatus Hamiltonella defensa]AYB48806.1 bifunctional tetrahydrofolate synthase/dihydrofolate synthase [Candidatus Hamiltonella defensa]